MSCQVLLNVRKTRGEWHRAEDGAGRSTETEINSLARSISQLIFHEGFSPSPPADCEMISDSLEADGCPA